MNDVEALNRLIKDEKWYDFYLARYDGHSALIKGTLDLSYGHNLEIHLEDVRYIDAPTAWKTDTTVAEVVKLFKSTDLDPRLRQRFLDQGGQWVLGFNAECFDSAHWFYFTIESFTFIHKGKWDEWQWSDARPIPGLR